MGEGQVREAVHTIVIGSTRQSLNDQFERLLEDNPYLGLGLSMRIRFTCAASNSLNYSRHVVDCSDPKSPAIWGSVMEAQVVDRPTQTELVDSSVIRPPHVEHNVDNI